MSQLVVLPKLPQAIQSCINVGNKSDHAITPFFEGLATQATSPVKWAGAVRRLATCPTSEICRSSSPIVSVLLQQDGKANQEWVINIISELVNEVHRSYCPNSSLSPTVRVMWVISILETTATIKSTALFAFFARCIFNNPYKDVYDMVDKHGLTKDMLFCWLGKFLDEYELEAEYARVEAQRPQPSNEPKKDFSDVVQKAFDEAHENTKRINEYIGAQRANMACPYELIENEAGYVEWVLPMYGAAVNAVKFAVSEFDSDILTNIPPNLPEYLALKTYLNRFRRIVRIGLYDILRMGDNIGKLIKAYGLPTDPTNAIRNVIRWCDNMISKEYNLYATQAIEAGGYLLTKQEYRILALNYLFKQKNLEIKL
jgi:hypothetical protein